MPKPKMSMQDLSFKTVIHSKAQLSLYSYTDLHPTQYKPSGCFSINKAIFAISNGAYKSYVLDYLLQVYIG